MKSATEVMAKVQPVLRPVAVVSDDIVVSIASD
jgi:hypothetical protein